MKPRLTPTSLQSHPTPPLRHTLDFCVLELRKEIEEKTITPLLFKNNVITLQRN